MSPQKIWTTEIDLDVVLDLIKKRQAQYKGSSHFEIWCLNQKEDRYKINGRLALMVITPCFQKQYNTIAHFKNSKDAVNVFNKIAKKYEYYSEVFRDNLTFSVHQDLVIPPILD